MSADSVVSPGPRPTFRGRGGWRAALVVCILSLAACGSSTSAGQGSAPQGGGSVAAAAPSGAPSSSAASAIPGSKPIDLIAFKAPTVAGGTFDASTLAGRPAAFWFWAPWCTTCRGLAPAVADLAEEFDGRLEVVGVSGLSADAQAMKRFVESTGIDGFDSIADTDGAVYTRFGITSQDSWVFIDAQGRVTSAAGLGPAEVRDAFAKLTT